MTRVLAGVVGCLGLAACRPGQRLHRAAPEADLASAHQVQWWEQNVRPDRMHFIATFIAAAGQQRCTPASQWDGPSPGCDDARGPVEGRARVRETDARLEVRFRDFGREGVEFGGRVEVGEQRFAMDLAMTDAAPEGDEPGWFVVRVRATQRPIGHYFADGEASAEGHGRVQFVASDVAIDVGECKTEPMSGTLRLRSAGRVATIEYDGATNCDRIGLAPWTLDDVPQDPLAVARVAMCTLGEVAPPWWALLVLPLARRRRRRS